MIISQTPLRISFFGGGTDLSSYYQNRVGRVLSTTIDKYIYVILKERYDNLIVLNYSEKEIVDSVDKIKHDLIRESLKFVGIDQGIEITTIADIPSKGSGLGSSSSLTVGLLNALYTYCGIMKDSQTLAEEACQIEIDILGNPIGKQDQYAATFGGLKLYTFHHDGKIDINAIDLDLSEKLALNENLYLVYTGITRSASNILSEQKQGMIDKVNLEYLDKIAIMPLKAQELLETQRFHEFGKYLDDAWALKKHLASTVTNTFVDDIYEKGKSLGAIGGKLLGAGGGGFVLFYVPSAFKEEFYYKIRETYRILPFKFEQFGTRIILNTGRNQHMI